MTKQFFLIFVAITLLTSCAFNKKFLSPLKLPTDHKRITMNMKNDTLVCYFSGENKQPTFALNFKDTLKLDYTVESKMFKSKSGNILNGWLLKPKNATAKITLLHFHGNGSCLFGHYLGMEQMVKRGFQVFMFDYSGFGFSEGDAKRKFVLNDGNSALDYLLTLPETKGTKIVIFGQSFGGNLATIVASQRQSEIDGLAIEGAFSSHKDIAANGSGAFGRIFVKEMYASKKYVKEIKKPILVIHSSEDKTIPYKMGQTIFTNANEPKQFFEIKGDHLQGTLLNADEIAQKINKMILQ